MASTPPKKTPATKSRREYDASTKASVMAALLTGQGVTEVAAKYKVPEGTVKSWRARMKPGSETDVAKVATEKREEIATLLIQYLHANLTTLHAQAVVFSSKEWLEKQNAADAAVLHGVLTDKTIRLLEALGGVSNSPV
jgi:transposase-like protein